MKRMFYGTVIALASMWIGAYFCNEYPPQTWQGFPAFCTAMLSFFAGGALFISGIVDVS
jgi:hypothetical protein